VIQRTLLFLADPGVVLKWLGVKSEVLMALTLLLAVM